MAKRLPARASDQPGLTFSTKKARGWTEEIARKAVAKRPTTPTVARPRDVAERLTARAISEGRNIEALVTEILEAEARRR